MFLVLHGGAVVESFVRWFMSVVTALSCLCAALYCMLAVEQLSLPEMQLSRASNRLSRPPVSLCLNENSRNSNNLCQFQKK